MPLPHRIDEEAVTGRPGTTVKVRVLHTRGGTATIQVEDCGADLRHGEIHTVPAAAVRGS